MRHIALLLTVAAIGGLQGCMTAPVANPGAASVRLLEKDPGTRCHYLTELSGYVMRYEHSLDVFDAKEKAFAAYQTELKNKVVHAGGDTAVLLARRADGSIYYDVYSVYRCL